MHKWYAKEENQKIWFTKHDQPADGSWKMQKRNIQNKIIFFKQKEKLKKKKTNSM